MWVKHFGRAGFQIGFEDLTVDEDDGVKASVSNVHFIRIILLVAWYKQKGRFPLAHI
jgi:hypothetical protein